MTTSCSFLQAYYTEVRTAYANDFTDNYDEDRFGPIPPESLRVGMACRALAKKALLAVGLGKVSSVSGHLEEAFRFVAPWLPRLERLYSVLADAESRSLLVKVVAFRALGGRKVKLPLDTKSRAAEIRRIEAVASDTDRMSAPSTSSPSDQYTLRRIDLSSLGMSASMYGKPTGIHRTFGIQQYRCSCLPRPIEAAPGDYVVDGGGCWGDTALYLADKVGGNGCVFSFEFVPKHLEIMRENFRINPSLSGRIEIIQNALWNVSGEEVRYEEKGPGTRLLRDDGRSASATARTKTIDDWVAERNLPKLDFLKMDIEGAELSALQGAEKSLKRFAPKLAICVYHRLDDFFDIPEYLNALNLGYRFYLRHFTIHSEETVLFAIEKTDSDAHAQREGVKE